MTQPENMKRWEKSLFAVPIGFRRSRRFANGNSVIKALKASRRQRTLQKKSLINLSKSDRYLSPEEIEHKYKHFLADEGDLVIASPVFPLTKTALLPNPWRIYSLGTPSSLSQHKYY